MNEQIETVKKYYDENAQKEWERLEKHPLEFIFTTYMMDQYIKPGNRVLDIGGGPGRYALHYAKQGCEVTLVDLSAGNIALAKEKAKEYGVSITTYEQNCLDLEELSLLSEGFDHVFLMGPLYHLTKKEDREKAVSLALDKLKPGGVFYCSFILDFAGLIYDLKNGPGFLIQDLENPQTRVLLDSIVTRTEYVGPSFTSAYFINQKQIEPFMSTFPVEKLHIFGQEGILALNEKQVLEFPKEELDLWVETAKRFLAFPEFLAFSEHAMYIGRKTAECLTVGLSKK